MLSTTVQPLLPASFLARTHEHPKQASSHPPPGPAECSQRTPLLFFCHRRSDARRTPPRAGLAPARKLRPSQPPTRRQGRSTAASPAPSASAELLAGGGRHAQRPAVTGVRPTLTLILKLFGHSHIYPYLLRRHSPFLPALPPPHAPADPYRVGYDEDTTPELAALSCVNKEVCDHVRGFFFTGVHLCVDEEDEDGGRPRDDDEDDLSEREVYNGVPWQEVLDGLTANPRLREHVEFLYIKHLSSLPPDPTHFTDHLATFLPLLPNLKGLVLYGASPPPALCAALARQPKLEDLEFFMFTDWRLPFELEGVTGLREIDVNPDRFLTEEEEEEEAAGFAADGGEEGGGEYEPRGVWRRSKDTLRRWVWANRETVRKVTVYDQSDSCLPLRHILQPAPDDLGGPTFPVLLALSLSATPHITHSALSLALRPPANPKGALEPTSAPVVANEWFLSLLPHVPLLENLTLSYNLTDAPSPYFAPSDAGGECPSEAGSHAAGCTHGHDDDDDDDDEHHHHHHHHHHHQCHHHHHHHHHHHGDDDSRVHHRQRTDYSLLPYHLNSLSTPSLRALRKLDLRLLSIAPSSPLSGEYTRFPDLGDVKHPVLASVGALRELGTLEELFLTVGRLDVAFLAAIADALGDVRGFRSLGVEVCAGGWGGGEGEDGEESGDGVYWGLRDGLLWGDHVETFARALSPLQNLRHLQASDSHSTFTRTIRFPSLLRGHCTPTFLSSVVRLRSLLAPEDFAPTASTFGRWLPALERVRWVTGGLKEAGNGDFEDAASSTGGGGVGGGRHEGHVAGEEVVLRDELWARDRAGGWMLLEQAIG